MLDAVWLVECGKRPIVWLPIRQNKNKNLLKRGGYAIALVAIVVSAAVVLNVLVGLLAKRVNLENRKIILGPTQQIYYGAPGTGKSHIIKKQTEGESVVRTTFHPDSDYSTFVGCYKPTTKEVEMRDVTGKVIIEHGQPVTENHIIYQFVDQAFF